MLRTFIFVLLTATVGLGQDLRVEPFSIPNRASDSATVFRQNNQSAAQNPPVDPGPSKSAVKRKSHKKRWLIVAVVVVAAVAVPVLVTLEKQRENEGGGIFR